MKKVIVIASLALLIGGIAFLPLFSARAAGPKRLLLVTTTLGFRHADVPLYEQILRQKAKETGEFTIISTTDSPDFPAAAYQAQVDQRNARIPLDKAVPNDTPALAGGFDGPRGTPAQLKAVSDLNASLAPLNAAVTSTTSALNIAMYSGDTADIAAKVDANVAAELAVAKARYQALVNLQASPNKLNLDQINALGQAAASGGRGGFGGRGGPQVPGAQPLSAAQQSAVMAALNSLAAQGQSAAASRTVLNSAPYKEGETASDLESKADAFKAAQLAYANAVSSAFAKIQVSPDKLTPEQVQLVAATGGRPNAGRGRGGAETPDPILAAVTKVLQQYLSPDKLKDYDAVAFCSTTGELPIPDKDAFFKWIADGHGFVGLHSATDTLHNTPEYIKMIGAEFAGHGAFHPKADVVNMDPESPIDAGWGKSIAIYEEFYLFKNYDPTQVHLLLALQMQPYTHQPGTYPVSWIKMYGKGRVYYTDLGHRDDVLLPDATIGDQEYKVRFNQAPVALAVQRQILNGVRWALGLIDADATPQAR
jgi:type 1 glutamine amidotransferase